MLLKDLKQNMFLPKKEISINKIVKIREIDVQLISLTSQEHRNVLWAMYQLPCYVDEEIDSEERTEYTTNRDDMINDISKEISSPPNIYISEIMIQNQKITFSSSSANRMCDMSYEGYMQLQHFIDNGMVTTNWNEVDLANIVISAYEQKESEEFPTIDLSKKLDITLKVSREFKQVLTNHPIAMEFGEMEKGNKFYFYDSIEKKNRICYIDKMEHYDIWEESNRHFEDERMQAFSEEQIKQMKEQYWACTEEICPKGMNLAILEYETEDGVQLNFYSKEYLDKRPVHKNSSSMMFFKSDKELGSNGFKSRVDMIKPVEKDFNGSIDVELFSWVMEIPEEIITV
jgi:hypothetical protein